MGHDSQPTGLLVTHSTMDDTMTTWVEDPATTLMLTTTTTTDNENENDDELVELGVNLADAFDLLDKPSKTRLLLPEDDEWWQQSTLDDDLVDMDQQVLEFLQEVLASTDDEEDSEDEIEHSAPRPDAKKPPVKTPAFELESFLCAFDRLQLVNA